MKNESDVKAAEESFFSALVTAGVKTLQALLTEDFLIIDVMSGREAGTRTGPSKLAKRRLVAHGISLSIRVTRMPSAPSALRSAMVR